MKVTERGWAGHFICADRCLFRRNTLIEGDNDRVVVSTVGAFRLEDGKIDIIGALGRYYETMVFGAKEVGSYIEADVQDERYSSLPWSISADSPSSLPKDVDNQANDMHEAIVQEFTKLLSEN